MPVLMTDEKAVQDELHQILEYEKKEADLVGAVDRLRTTVEELRAEISKEEEQTAFPWIYPMAVGFLGLTMLAVVAGVFLLRGVWDVGVPDALIAVGAAAVAALAGLVSIPSKK